MLDGQPQILHIFAVERYLVGLLVADDALVYAVEIYVEAQTRRGIGLRVGVEQQDASSQKRHRCGEVDRGRGLSHAALLICQCNNFCHFALFPLIDYSGKFSNFNRIIEARCRKLHIFV